MDAKETFNHVAKDYRAKVNSAISFSGLTTDFFAYSKLFFLNHFIKKSLTKNTKTLKILDIGCGIGEMDILLKKTQSHLTGIDISAESLKIARLRNPEVNYNLYDGHKLPFADASMDVAFTINVMHHVPPQEWPNFVSEAMRVVRPGGLFIVFEHNPYNPLTLKAVENCEFDQDAVLLKKKDLIKLIRPHRPTKLRSHYILFFPFSPICFRHLELKIGFIPLGAQYGVCVIK